MRYKSAYFLRAENFIDHNSGIISFGRCWRSLSKQPPTLLTKTLRGREHNCRKIRSPTIPSSSTRSADIKKPRKCEASKHEKFKNLSRNNAHMLTVFRTFHFKLNNTFLQSKQSIVFTHTYILTWMKRTSTLTKNNCAGIDVLPCVTFYAKTFRIRIATVP